MALEGRVRRVRGHESMSTMPRSGQPDKTVAYVLKVCWPQLGARKPNRIPSLVWIAVCIDVCFRPRTTFNLR